MGRQPFGLASPAAWLRRAGHEVSAVDLSVIPFPVQAVREANLVAVYLPMHTATRLASAVVTRVRTLNSGAALCAYGLYAPMAEEHLRELGVTAFFGGEFEPALVDFAAGSEPGSNVSLDKLRFVEPDRAGLPALARYPKLITIKGKRTAGYTEASRGCKHLCRHCPVVPVYGGAFRVVQADVVLADIRNQVAGGAQHISFGDPDFFNGPTHARHIVEALHAEFPLLTYDVTIKIEHLLKHRDMLPVLARTGCAFVISAVESLEDAVLENLAKGHTRADFLQVVDLFRQSELVLSPTFLPFTPWTTRHGYAQLLDTLRELRLTEHVPPVQLALRLLIPAGSRILELDEVRESVTGFDPAALVWRWKHPDPAVDQLAADVMGAVQNGVKIVASRAETFDAIWQLVHGRPAPVDEGLLPRTVIPYMEEPWFC